MHQPPPFPPHNEPNSFPNRPNQNPYIHPDNRQFPVVQIKQFTLSARRSLELLRDAQLFLNAVATNEAYARELMDAAQRSQTNKVIQLIQSIGIRIRPEIYFNPDGLLVRFARLDEDQKKECCRLLLELRWKK
jgi:cell division FtsZ-interacting protein ZapD